MMGFPEQASNNDIYSIGHIILLCRYYREAKQTCDASATHREHAGKLQEAVSLKRGLRTALPAIGGSDFPPLFV
jgi:hypothetical protein